MNDILFREIYQLLFIMSTIYFVCVVLIFILRVIRNVVYDINTTMNFTLIDKILILLSASLILTYLI